jgi:hypothetical protein
MSQDPNGNPWWLVLIASVPSAGGGVWVFWRWWLERSDKRDEKRVDAALTREERLMKEMDARASVLSKENADLLDRVKAELGRLQTRCADLEKQRDALEADRDRGWDLARWWNKRAHEMRHACANAQTVAQNLLIASGKEPATWPDMSLPNFEDPTSFSIERPKQ